MRDDPCFTVLNAECGSTGTCVCTDGFVKEETADVCIKGIKTFI